MSAWISENIFLMACPSQMASERLTNWIEFLFENIDKKYQRSFIANVLMYKNNDSGCCFG